MKYFEGGEWLHPSWYRLTFTTNRVEINAFPHHIFFISQSLDSFLLVATADGTILYTTENISTHLGFHPVDLVHRCIYGIVHPDDHSDVKNVLEQNLISEQISEDGPPDDKSQLHTADPKKVSFLCRMKCFNGTSTGYVKMLCNGTMHTLPEAVKSRTSPCQVLFASFQVFSAVTANTDLESNSQVFWTRHKLDFTTTSVDDRIEKVLGMNTSEVLNTSFYQVIHPDDLATVYTCHKAILETEESHIILLRLRNQAGSWVWLHSYGQRVTLENSEEEIVFTHTIASEEHLPFLHQEESARSRYSHEEYLKLISSANQENEQFGNSTSENAQRRRWTSNDTYVVASQLGHKLKDDYSVSLHSPHGACPSSFHQTTDCQSELSTASSDNGQEASQHRTFGQSHHLMNNEYPQQVEGAHHISPDFIGDTSMLAQYSDINPALSMYQMVAHLPPEMYDVNTYRKHALRLMENAHREWYHHRMPTLSHMPTTSSEMYYQHQESMVNQFPNMSGAPPTPPTTPNILSYSQSGSQDPYHHGYNRPSTSWTEHYMNGLQQSQAEYCASYIVNGEVQVKLVRNGMYPWNTNGYYGDSYSSGSKLDHSIGSCRYPYDSVCRRDQDSKPGFESEVSCKHSSRYGYFSGNERLPCPMANTKDGCLARRIPDPEQPLQSQQSYDEAVLSQLPPINSFLGFLQEELPPC
ncbi:Aryl hydrocarbon receptor [Holothuria leucospilota]|uniref:Aryl hydrocarbon receptor n=1 Tax=Holothuria leucospilota TaxID=206669 RepID=A0A9Q1BH17_HOLLE|nr:Aryl hydrocarbon receptor [Holothuria leucospilota]